MSVKQRTRSISVFVLFCLFKETDAMEAVWKMWDSKIPWMAAMSLQVQEREDLGRKQDAGWW